jgi:hypothetical protein
MKKRWGLIFGTVGLLGLSAIATWVIGIRNLEVMQCRVIAGIEQALDDVVPGRFHRPVLEKLQGALALGFSGQVNRCSALLMKHPVKEHPACSSHTACKVRVYRFQKATPQIRVIVETRPATKPLPWSRWIQQS